MTREAAVKLVLDAIAEVAPDTTDTPVDPEIPLQEQLDLDSMDFLAVLGAVAEETGLDIPERDYPRLVALGSAADYLVEHVPAAAGG